MATRLRHIAIIVPEPETAAQFFENAFDMKRVGSGRRGIYMSHGVMNVALLKRETDKERIGLYHFGMWVDDLADPEKKVFDAGGTSLGTRSASCSTSPIRAGSGPPRRSSPRNPRTPSQRPDRCANLIASS